jgi:hypothetical protein
MLTIPSQPKIRDGHALANYENDRRDTEYDVGNEGGEK